MAEAHVSGLRAQHVSAVQRFDQRKGRFDSSATKRSRCFWSAFVTDFWSTTWSKSSLIAFAISMTVRFGVFARTSQHPRKGERGSGASL